MCDIRKIVIPEEMGMSLSLCDEKEETTMQLLSSSSRLPVNGCEWLVTGGS